MKLLKNAQVFSPEYLGIAHVLIAGEAIVYVGAELPELGSALAVETLDLEGAPLVPGFIDAHAHITGGGGETGPSSRVPPVHLSEFTRAGVTSVVGVLGTDDVTRNTETLVQQAYGLREEGLSAWCYTGGYHVPLTTLAGNARRDITFIDPIIGVGELALSDHRSSQPTFDEFLRIASDAYVAGLMTGKAGIVHCHMGDGARGLSMIHKALRKTEIPPRVFNPTHVNRNRTLFEDALSLVGKGCNIDLTAFPDGHIEPGLSAVDAYLAYRDAGLPAHHLTISSDGGGCLPHFDTFGNLLHMGVGLSDTLPETIAALVKKGVPLQDALLPLTKNVAKFLRFSRKGEIAKGFDADLVILDEDTMPRDVMARGRWHKFGGEVKVYGSYEAHGA